VRRKPGALVPLEIGICLAASDLFAAGTREFHGYQLAKQLAESGERKSLAAYGTLYRALARLVEMGMVTDRWEDPQLAARDRRPLRRLYALTINGRRVANWHRASAEATPAKRAGTRRAPA
jgi:PadR family transcriptional regulator, regulatory protein PadR